MKNVLIEVVLPTTRVSGLPLDPADIAKVELSMSADSGNTFSFVDNIIPPDLDYQLNDLPPGTYIFRGTVEDTQERRSTDLDETATIEDESDPSPLASMTVTVL